MIKVSYTHIVVKPDEIIKECANGGIFKLPFSLPGLLSIIDFKYPGIGLPRTTNYIDYFSIVYLYNSLSNKAPTKTIVFATENSKISEELDLIYLETINMNSETPIFVGLLDE